MKTISVKTGRPYEIKIGTGLFAQLPELLKPVLGTRCPKLAIITDDIVNGYYGDAVHKNLEHVGCSVCRYVFPHGESSKTLDMASAVYAFLAQNNITRSDMIVTLGGGVVGDLAGFVAATWLRGIEFIQLPTTFLAMIDSSVGGKTGVDIPQGKNLVGAFHQPSLVVCDLDAAQTLPEDVFTDGIAEAIKYGAILDEDLFALIEGGGLKTHFEEIVYRCIDLKRAVVEADEYDHGIRMWLNFGHTFGHAIEAQSNFSVSHGKGVAIGMVLLTQVCERHGITPSGSAQRIADCCIRYGLPVATDYPLDVLCKHCMGDKKRSGGKLNLVVLEAIGKAMTYPIAAADLYTFMGGNCNG